MNEHNQDPYTMYTPPVWDQQQQQQSYSPAAADPAPKKRGRFLKITALALSCVLLGGAMGVGGVFLGQSLRSPAAAPTGNVSTMLEGVREKAILNVEHLDTSRELTPAELYAANVNSTVGIQTTVTTNFWGYQTTAPASGSGFILTADGYILTNYHVVDDSTSITVSLYDGSSYDAKLVGYDENNDIAVLKVDAKDLTPVVLGNSDDLHVGDSVIAIGNPLGELTFSLTSGAVSALDRDVTMSNGVTMNLIQTDCAINSGNSGGALFNLYGEVIGITNAKYSGSSGSQASIDNIGFAIPINQIRNIVQSIIEKGYIAKPYIGVKVADVSSETQSYGLPAGASVREVTENGPAGKAGLQVNDIITAVNGEAVSGSQDLVKRISAAASGDELTLSVYRQGETLSLSLTVGEQVQEALGDQPEEPEPSDDASQGSSIFPWNFLPQGQ